MPAPQPTVWIAEPHTLAKHAILKGYLEAWFPILSRHRGRVVYFDGFAGPGRYSHGEDGSPVIALKVALAHRPALQAELVFTFVEERADRAAHLRSVEIPALALPPNFKTQVATGEFASVLGRTLDALDIRGQQIAPTFAFVDPFGISGLPFSLVSRLLRRPRCEVLITFMTSTINRFVTELPDHVNDLIGDDGAADIIAAASDRVSTTRLLYQQALGRVASHVRFFQMQDTRNLPVYDLFFATNHPLGLAKMKEAMWGVDATGSYLFSDRTDPNQTILFTSEPGLDLARSLAVRFAGQTVTTQAIFREVLDSTPYIEKHARDALGLLELAHDGLPPLRVEPLKTDGSKRRKGTFPEGVVLHFDREQSDE
jgi:three-Cys-motif partner protein